MTRVPALPFTTDAAEAQIETAMVHLARLLARHVVRDLAADAPTPEEQPDAVSFPEEA